MPIKNKFISIIVLISVNLFPIVGVLYFGWDIFETIMIYVAETFIIGLYNVLKMSYTDSPKKTIWIPFFLLHYNIFIIAQTIFVVIYFGEEESWDRFFSLFRKQDIHFNTRLLSKLLHNGFNQKSLTKRVDINLFSKC